MVGRAVLASRVQRLQDGDHGSLLLGDQALLHGEQLVVGLLHLLPRVLAVLEAWG